MPDRMPSRADKQPAGGEKEKQLAAAMIEFLFAAMLIAVVFTSLVYYIKRYRELDEEVVARNAMQLGRLNVVPPMLLKDARNSCVVPVVNTFHTQVGGWLSAAYVSRDLVVNNSCRVGADPWAFFVRVTGSTAGTIASTVLGASDDDADGTIDEQIYDCEGGVHRRGTLGADDAKINELVREAEAVYLASGATEGATFVVVYSHARLDLPGNIQTADRACLDPEEYFYMNPTESIAY